MWDIGKYSSLHHSHTLSILRKRKQIQREKQYREFLVWFSSQREERTLVALTGWLSVTTVLWTRPFLEGTQQHSYRHKREALLCLPRHASYGWCLYNYQTGQTCDCSVYRGVLWFPCRQRKIAMWLFLKGGARTHVIMSFCPDNPMEAEEWGTHHTALKDLDGTSLRYPRQGALQLECMPLKEDAAQILSHSEWGCQL